jgi:serine/threonine-protein kinase HipA
VNRSAGILDLQVTGAFFNVLIGHCDAHAKNIALLRSLNGQWRLAPFYDLVSTITYPNLSHELAMGVASQFDIGRLQSKHWQLLFKECNVSLAKYLKIFSEMAQELPESIVEVKKEFIADYGDSPIISMMEKTYKKNLNRFLMR